MKADLLERLGEVRCDRAAFTPDHAGCICRLTTDAADEIERLQAALTTIRDTLPERQDAYALLVFATAAEALEPETVT